MSERKRIVITGASGLFGSNAMRIAKDRYEALGLTHASSVSWPGVRTRKLDLESEREIASLLDSFRPEAVIHAAADANIDRCEIERDAATRINVDVPRSIARLCADRGIRMVHFSTDAFFEGDGVFDEDSLPRPISFYGETKALSEEAVRKADPRHLIVRPNFHGWNAQDKLSLSEWILRGLVRQEPLPLFEDVVFSPLYVESLCEALFAAVDRGTSGILNLCGDEGLSKLDFGKRIGETFGLSLECVRPTRVADSTLKARRSKRMVLSPKKLREVAPGVDLSVRGGLLRMRARLEDGTVSALKGRPFSLSSLA